MKFSLNALAMLFLVAPVMAKMVEYVEDPYSMQAPHEWVAKVAQVAEKLNFNSNYEVVIPKKAGLQINPWNQFIGSGTNPGTQNLFVVINPEWLASLAEPQQEFLIGRGLMFAAHGGANPWTLRLMRIFFIFMGLIFIFLLFKLLSTTVLAHQNMIVQILAAVLINFVIAYTVTSKIEQKLATYFAQRHDTNINEMVIAKMGDRPAAIAALEAFDTGIKNEIAHGETVLNPFSDMFATQAQALQQS